MPGQDGVSNFKERLERLAASMAASKQAAEAAEKADGRKRREGPDLPVLKTKIVGLPQGITAEPKVKKRKVGKEREVEVSDDDEFKPMAKAVKPPKTGWASAASSSTTSSTIGSEGVLTEEQARKFLSSEKVVWAELANAKKQELASVSNPLKRLGLSREIAKLDTVIGSINNSLKEKKSGKEAIEAYQKAADEYVSYIEKGDKQPGILGTMMGALGLLISSVKKRDEVIAPVQTMPVRPTPPRPVTTPQPLNESSADAAPTPAAPEGPAFLRSIQQLKRAPKPEPVEQKPKTVLEEVELAYQRCKDEVSLAFEGSKQKKLKGTVKELITPIAAANEWENYESLKADPKHSNFASEEDTFLLSLYNRLRFADQLLKKYVPGVGNSKATEEMMKDPVLKEFWSDVFKASLKEVNAKINDPEAKSEIVENVMEAVRATQHRIISKFLNQDISEVPAVADINVGRSQVDMVRELHKCKAFVDEETLKGLFKKYSSQEAYPDHVQAKQALNKELMKFKSEELSEQLRIAVGDPDSVLGKALEGRIKELNQRVVDGIIKYTENNPEEAKKTLRDNFARFSEDLAIVGTDLSSDMRAKLIKHTEKFVDEFLRTLSTVETTPKNVAIIKEGDLFVDFRREACSQILPKDVRLGLDDKTKEECSHTNHEMDLLHAKLKAKLTPAQQKLDLNDEDVARRFAKEHSMLADYNTLLGKKTAADSAYAAQINRLKHPLVLPVIITLVESVSAQISDKELDEKASSKVLDSVIKAAIQNEKFFEAAVELHQTKTKIRDGSLSDDKLNDAKLKVQNLEKEVGYVIDPTTKPKAERVLEQKQARSATKGPRNL